MLTLAAAETLRAVAASATAITYTVFGMELNAGVESYKTLAQGQLPSSAGTLYTAPASTQTFVKSIHFANATGADVTGVKLFKNGTVAANQITGSLTIPANGWAVYNDDGWAVFNALGEQLMNGVTASGGSSSAITSSMSRFSYNYSTTITAGNPGTGLVRLSTLTPDTVDTLTLYINNTDSGATDRSTTLAAILASDIHRVTTIDLFDTSETDTIPVQLRVDTVTVQSGYLELACTVLSSVTGWGLANNAPIKLQIDTQSRGRSMGTFGSVGGSYLYGIPNSSVSYTSNLAPTASTLYAIPFYTDTPMRIRSFCAIVAVLATVNTDARFGIYRGITFPGNLPKFAGKVAEVAAPAFLGTTGVRSVIANITLPPGFYWAVMAFPAFQSALTLKTPHGLYNHWMNVLGGAGNDPLKISNECTLAGNFSAALPAAFSTLVPQTTNLSGAVEAQALFRFWFEWWPIA